MAANASGPAEFVQPITKGSALPSGPCRQLLVGVAGTLNITVAGVALVNVPVIAGYNPIRIQSVQVGGTATDLWALY